MLRQLTSKDFKYNDEKTKGVKMNDMRNLVFNILQESLVEENKI